MRSQQIEALAFALILTISAFTAGGAGLVGANTASSIDSAQTITGQLSYEDGSAVSDWKVLAGSGSDFSTNMTNGSGSFSLDVSTNDTYTVWYQQYNPGYSAAQNFPRDGQVDLYAVGDVNTSMGEDIGAATLPNGSLLNVEVVDESGTAVPNASVRISHVRNGVMAPIESQTNTNGRAVIDGNDIPGLEVTGDVKVEVRGPSGYAKNFSTISVSADRNYTVTIQKNADVFGTITDAAGSAVSNGTVLLKNENTYQGTQTDTSGGFSTSVPSGESYEYVFYQRPDDSSPADNVPDLYPFGTVSIAGSTNLSQQLPDGHNLTVVVTRPDGTRVSNATVHIHQERDNAHAGEGFETDENGELSVEVTGGTDVHVIPPSGSNLAEENTHVSVSDDQTISLQLQKAVTINGTIHGASGGTAPGVEVTYHTDDGVHAHSKTDTNGEYSMGVVPNRTYHLDLKQTGLDGSPSFPNDGVPDIYAYGFKSVGETDESHTLNLPYGNDLNITVVDPNGTVVPGATVHVAHIKLDRGTGVSGSTNNNGLFVPSGASTPGIEVNGTVDVHVEPPSGSNLAASGADVTVASNDSVTIQLQKAVTISGYMATGDGLGPSGWNVEMAPQEQDAAGFDTLTGYNGSFSGQASQHSSFFAQFRQRDHDGATPDFPKDGIPDVHPLGAVSTGTSDVFLGSTQLPKGHLLNVTVVNESGSPVEGVDIHVEVHGQDAVAWDHGQTTQTGEMLLEGASTPGLEVNGQVKLNFRHSSWKYGYTETTVDVTSNQSITVTLPNAMNVTGTVLEPDGSPATDERVNLHALHAPHGDVTWTTSNGSFSAPVDEDGTYEVGFVQVPGEGQYDGSFPNDGVPDLYALGVADNTSKNLGTIQLPDPHNLTVVVENSSGHRLSDVRVWLSHHNGEASRGENQYTDANGKVTAELVGEVGIHIDPENPEYRDNGTQIQLTGDQTVRVVLNKGVPVTGQLVNPDGSGTSGWTIEAFHEGGDNVLTNSDGTYTLHVDPNNDYDLAYKQTDWGGGKADFPKDGIPDLYAFYPFSVGSSGKDLGTQQLPPGHLVNITVENESGTPLSGIDVDVIPEKSDASGHHPGYTNANGEVVLDGAATPGVEANGTLRLHIPNTGTYAEAVKTIDINSSKDVTIVLKEPANLTGRIIYPDGSTHVDDSVVTFGSEQTNSIITFDRTDEDGSFTLSTPPADDVDIQFYQGAYWVTGNESKPIAPRDGVVDMYGLTQVDATTGDVDVGNQTLPTGHVLNVTVVDPGGNPVQNATIAISHYNGPIVPDPESGPADAGLNELLTNANGQLQLGAEFNSDATPPPGIELQGNVTVRVNPPQDTQEFKDKTYTRNLTVDSQQELTITLEKRPTVEGDAFYPDSTPVTDAFVVLEGTGGEPWKFTKTDGSGHYSTGLPEDDTYGVTIMPVVRDGIVDVYYAGSFAVSGPTQIPAQQLPQGYDLDVKVVTQDGSPIENASVAYYGAQKEDAGGWLIKTNESGYAITDDGQHTGIEMAGDVRIKVQPPENSTKFGDQTITKNLTVTSNQTVEVTLTEAQPKFSVDYSVESKTVPTGEPVNVTATVTNTGNATGTKTVSLSVEQQSETVTTSSKDVTVAPGKTKTVTFSESLAPGSYDVTVDDLDSTIVTVTDSVDVSLNVTDAQVGVGQNATAEIVVSNLSDGVGSYDLNVTVGNATVSKVVDAQVAIQATDDITVAGDGSQARLIAYNGDTVQTGSVAVAAVELNATAVGETDVEVEVTGVGPESGSASYYVGTTQNDSLSVVPVPTVGNFSHRPTDTDGDGTFEDVNGDGSFDLSDVQALFQNEDDTVVNQYADAFDFNGNGDFDIVDVQALYYEYKNEGA